MRRLLTILLTFAATPIPAQTTDWPTFQLTVDATSDADFARVNLATGKVLASDDSTTNWDLAIKRYEFRLGAGASAALIVDNTVVAAANPYAGNATSQLPAFDAITAADIPATKEFTTTIPNSVALEDSPPFLYGLDPASPHAVLPTFNIYLVPSGDAVHKIQMLDYYHPVTGASRYITLRAARVQ